MFGVEYAYYDHDADVWSSIVVGLALALAPEPVIRKWAFCKGKLYENIGALPDGSLFNPNGYDEALVREALATPQRKRKPRAAGPRQVQLWTKAEIAKLRELAPTHTQAEAAKAMGRKSINGAASYFRITFAKPLTWTPEKVDQLRELAPTHTVSEAAIAIGMSFDSVQSSCRKHKVSFRKVGGAS